MPAVTPPGGELFSQLSDPAVAVFVSDGEPRVQAVNRAFTDTFEREQESIHGEPLRAVLTDSVGADRIPSEFERAFRSADQPTFIVRACTDAERTFRCTAVRRTHSAEPADRPHEVAGWLILADITDAYETIGQLRDERETLHAVIRHVTHDVRNPLEVATIHLEAARETGEEIHFERVSGALARIEQLASEVLPLPVSDSTADTHESVALEEAARRAWDTVNTQTATLSVDDDLPMVQANDAQLQTLFENLFRNAVEHGGTDVDVCAGRTAGGFYVADDGAGLPPDSGDEIFEPGQSAHDQGRGYGLALVTSVVEQHGWTVRATSRSYSRQYEYSDSLPRRQSDYSCRDNTPGNRTGAGEPTDFGAGSTARSRTLFWQTVTPIRAERARQSCVRGSGTAGSVRLSRCSHSTASRDSTKRDDPVPVPHFRDGTGRVFELRSLAADRLPGALHVLFTGAVAAITSGATPKLRLADHPPRSDRAPLLCDAIPDKHRCDLLRSC